MTVSIEAYRCAVGQSASISVTLLSKKVVKTACKVHDSKVFTGGHSGVFCLTCTVNNVSLHCAVLCSNGVVWGHLHRKERMNTVFEKCLSWTRETVMNGCAVMGILHKSQKGKKRLKFYIHTADWIAKYMHTLTCVCAHKHTLWHTQVDTYRYIYTCIHKHAHAHIGTRTHDERMIILY